MKLMIERNGVRFTYDSNVPECPVLLESAEWVGDEGGGIQFSVAQLDDIWATLHELRRSLAALQEDRDE